MIIGASGSYGKGILARAEQIGVEVVVVTRSPVHRAALILMHVGSDKGRLGRPHRSGEHPRDPSCAVLAHEQTVALPFVLFQSPQTPFSTSPLQKAAGVTRYIGMGSGPMMMPGEKAGGFQRTIHPLLSLLKLFGVTGFAIVVVMTAYRSCLKGVS